MSGLVAVLLSRWGFLQLPVQCNSRLQTRNPLVTLCRFRISDVSTTLRPLGVSVSPDRALMGLLLETLT